MKEDMRAPPQEGEPPAAGASALFSGIHSLEPILGSLEGIRKNLEGCRGGQVGNVDLVGNLYHCADVDAPVLLKALVFAVHALDASQTPGSIATHGLVLIEEALKAVGPRPAEPLPEEIPTP